MKTSTIKRVFSTLAVILLLLAFGLFAIASGDSSEDGSEGQGSENADKDNGNSNLGEYNIQIKSCRLAEDYEGKPIVIVNYTFTNNSDDATSFMIAFNDTVYQDGIGLNGCYFVAESANYSSDNQTKDIKKGASIDVEVAYELNDTTTDIEVEVKELISFSDKVVKKTFKIAE